MKSKSSSVSSVSQTMMLPTIIFLLCVIYISILLSFHYFLIYGNGSKLNTCYRRKVPMDYVTQIHSHYIHTEKSDAGRKDFNTLTTFITAANLKTNVEKAAIGNVTGKRFPYLIKPDRKICMQNGTVPDDIHVLVMICSAVMNFAARDAIRKTWLSEQPLKLNHIIAHKVFIVGKVINESLHGHLQTESSKHGDILQGDFLDTYNNLTLKSIFALQWASEYDCDQVDFIIKGDDDAYININNLIRYAADKHLNNTFLGYCLTGIKPERNSNSKWFVPKSLYPGVTYPPFVAGWAYLMPGNLLKPLYSITQTLPLLHLEDIFITGVCGGKLGAGHMGHPGFQARLNISDIQMLKSFFAVHFVTVDDHYRFWNAVQKVRERV